MREKKRRNGDGGTKFRWRSHEITRIEGFSDAVFAFAITLLVVSLEVPKTFHELQEMMSGFVAFGLGSALLFIIWYNQYKFFRLYGLQDALTIVLNGILLFVVLFFVYPVKFLFTYLVRAVRGESVAAHFPDGTIAPMIEPGQFDLLMIIYGLGYVAVFLLLMLLHIHAYRRADALQLTALERHDTRGYIVRNLLNILIGAASMTIVLLRGPAGAGWAGMTYMLVGPVLWLQGEVGGRQRRTLARTLTTEDENGG